MKMKFGPYKDQIVLIVVGNTPLWEIRVLLLINGATAVTSWITWHDADSLPQCGALFRSPTGPEGSEQAKLMKPRFKPTAPQKTPRIATQFTSPLRRMKLFALWHSWMVEGIWRLKLTLMLMSFLGQTWSHHSCQCCREGESDHQFIVDSKLTQKVLQF